MKNIVSILAILGFVAAQFGFVIGLLALSDGYGWGWAALIASVATLCIYYWQAREMRDAFSSRQRVVMSHEEWIGIRGFVSGFALAIAIWAGTTDSMAGRVIAAICVAVIGLCVYAGAFGRDR